MRVVTWNVNSVVARTERLVDWLRRHQPDVVCLQELKAEDARFPAVEVRALGYEVALHGQSAYNGVAILARHKPDNVGRGFDDGRPDDESRLIAADVGGLRVINVYVPNGQDLASDRFPYKLEWLGRLRAYLERRHTPSQPIVLCGDFNCAPDQSDVGRPELFVDSVLTHEKVREHVRAILAWGFVDLVRRQFPEGGVLSWWDYRSLAFAKNIGLRIDLMLATAPVAERLQRAWIDRDERKGKKPSDHVPVVAELGGA